MRTLHFNKNSWHYKLAEFSSTSPSNISYNFCGYFWQVIFGIMIGILMFGFSIMVLLLLVLCPILYLIVCLQYQIFEVPVEVGVGLFIDIVILIIYVSSKIQTWLDNHREMQRQKDYDEWIANGYASKPQKQAGFIVTTWQTFKDKTCFKIDFEG